MRKDFSPHSSWARFSRKLMEKIETPRYVGFFTAEEASMKNMFFTSSLVRNMDGFFAAFFLLVDESDGVIADAKFQAFGPPSLLGVMETCCDLVMRKNYDQAKRIGAELIDTHLRDKKDKEAIPREEYAYVNLALEALEEACSQCEGISLPEAYVPTPMQPSLEGGPYPGWDTLTLPQQIQVLEDLIAVEVRPYIELDAGGIEIVSLTEGRDLVIAYKGACTTCPSSIGSTLQAIQQILSARIHPDIKVIPDRSFLL